MLYRRAAEPSMGVVGLSRAALTASAIWAQRLVE